MRRFALKMHLLKRSHVLYRPHRLFNPPHLPHMKKAAHTAAAAMYPAETSAAPIVRLCLIIPTIQTNNIKTGVSLSGTTPVLL